MPDRLRVVLASASKRRQQLLAEMGLDFFVRPSGNPEKVIPGETPDEFVFRMALEKHRAASPCDGEVVVAADTVVVLDGRILGKPTDAEEAVSMLMSMRGRAHQVKTAIAVGTGRTLAAEVVTTTVWMRDYSDSEIEEYVSSGEPFDKAGGYAIQDEKFAPVAYYQGCPMNVVGLPICRVAFHLGNFDVPVPVDPAEVCRRWFGEGCGSWRSS